MNERILLRVSLAAILILAVFSLPACNSSGNVQRSEGTGGSPPTDSPEVPSDGVRRVTIPELRAALEMGEAVVVDVRGEVEHKLGHIKGARSLPLGLIAQRSGDLPRDKLIVTYCA